MLILSIKEVQFKLKTSLRNESILNNLSFFPPKLLFLYRSLLMSCKGTLILKMFISIKQDAVYSLDSHSDSYCAHHVCTISIWVFSLVSIPIILNYVCSLCHFLTQDEFHSSPPAQRTSTEWRRSHGGHATPSLFLSPATPNMPSLTPPCTESPVGGAAAHSLRQALQQRPGGVY